jgi:hypothetical protein
MHRSMLCVLAVFVLTNEASAQKQSKRLMPILDDAQSANWLVRLDDGSGHYVDGRIMSRSDTLVRVGRSTVDLHNVQRVFHGSREGGGGLIGGLIGGGVLGGMGLMAAASCNINCGPGRTLGLFGFGVGLFVGLLVGEAAQPGHMVWREVAP